jgi:hypothetical protein
MKNIFKHLLFFSIIFLAFSCEELNEGVNENPNDIIVSDVEERLFLTGGMLANVQIQLGHLNRISGMYSGQLIGYSSLYSNIYGLSLSTAESNGTWNALYVGVLTNMRHIIANSNNDLLRGIAMVVEAHAFGTATSLFGDIPYSEAGNSEIQDPAFDSQVQVYSQVIARLDEAITTLNSASSGSIPEDIYFGGDKAKWIAAANTLKARFYLHQKDYPSALTAAQNGIGSASGDMRFIPGDAAQEDDNLFWMILEGSRGGDIGNDDGVTDSYLLELIDPANSSSRNNAKTDETARRGFYFVNPASGSDNDGIIEKMQPQNMVTFFENKLIMAEAAARGGTVASALPHLNQVRAWLNDGGNLNDNYLGQAHRYDPYVEADFNAGGIENADNITPTNAFLREVIEERYVSGFGMHMPYNDARRLRKSDGAIAVPYVMYNSDNTRKPERMPYATNELNSNSNAPSEDPGIFTKTQVNQ